MRQPAAGPHRRLGADGATHWITVTDASVDKIPTFGANTVSNQTYVQHSPKSG